jgi:multicomponent Na+:H+ antiporter subunit G
MQAALDITSWILLGGDSAFLLIGGIGVLRFQTLYARMHAASLTDSIGTLLVLLGILLQAGWTLAGAKIAAILIFMMLTGPTASYALANAAYLSGIRPKTEHDNS